MTYQFGTYQLNPDRMELRNHGLIERVEPQVFALLALLIANRDRVVTRQEINESVWKGRAVSDAAVDSRMRSARQAIGDNGRDQHMIKTIPNEGFRFVGEVQVLTETISTSPLPDERHREAPIAQKPIAQKNDGANWSSARLSLLTAAALGLLLIGAFTGRLISNLGSKPTNPVDLASGDAEQTFITEQSGIGTIGSIAVLPFADMSASLNQQYFGDAIAEQLLNELAAIEQLKVSSRTSSFSFRERAVKITDIAQALQVDHILEGSVRRNGNALRITAQLIEAKSDRHLWSQTYDHDITDGSMFEAQDQISTQIIDLISQSLNLPPRTNKPYKTLPTAYAAYLRGNALRDQRTSQSLDLAIEQYNAALAIDENFAAAYAGLATTYRLMYYYQDAVLEDIIPHMTRATQKAEELAPDQFETYYAKATLAQFQRRYEDAVTITQEAITLNRNDSAIHALRASALSSLGRMDEAVASYNAALALDPLSPDLLLGMTYLKLDIGDYDGALATAKRNMKWNAENLSALKSGSLLYWNMGDYKTFHDTLIKARELDKSDTAFSVTDLIFLYTDIGIDPFAQNIPRTKGDEALIHAITGNDRMAMDILRSIPNGFDAEDIPYFTENFDLAAEILQNPVISIDFADDTPIRGELGSLYAEACFVFRQTGNGDAQIIFQKLARRYLNQNPGDFLSVEDRLGGVGYHILNNDVSTALIWLDHLIDQGHAFLPLTGMPLYAALEDHPDFQPRKNRMIANAASHRSNIGIEH